MKRRREYVVGDWSTPEVFVPRLIGAGVALLLLIFAVAQSTYVIQPGYRGVRVTLGNVSPGFLREGFGFKTPFITTIVPLLVRQRTYSLKAECYSADLQQVNLELSVLYRIPEESIVRIFQDYAGDPFDNLIAPRVMEALKEVVALQTAENVVTNRLVIKRKALDLARAKIGAKFLDVGDLVLQDILLSKELQAAIEQKMVQEQEAAKAKFTQRQAEIDAETAVIKARGTAEAISIRGTALKLNPAFVDLQIIEKWDGKSPLVIQDAGNSANLLVPLDDVEKTKR